MAEIILRAQTVEDLVTKEAILQEWTDDFREKTDREPTFAETIRVAKSIGLEAFLTDDPEKYANPSQT